MITWQYICKRPFDLKQKAFIWQCIQQGFLPQVFLRGAVRHHIEDNHELPEVDAPVLQSNYQKWKKMTETFFVKSVLSTSFWGLNFGMALPTRFKDWYSGKKNIQQFFGAVVPGAKFCLCWGDSGGQRDPLIIHAKVLASHPVEWKLCNHRLKRFLFSF